MDDKKYENFEEYFRSQKSEAREKLQQLREIVKEIVPEATETISYNMPAFRYHGILIYMAAHKQHIGFYPASSKTLVQFKEELKDYQTSKGTIRINLDQEIPVDLIKKIVAVRGQENFLKKSKKSSK